MIKHPSILIGEYLRLQRKQHRLTIEQLADKSNLSSSQISVIERGCNPITGKYNNITLSSLELLGNGLDMTVQEILENSGYFYTLHDTIKLSEKKLSKYMQNLFISRYVQLNDTNQKKVNEFVSSLLLTQGTEE